MTEAGELAVADGRASKQNAAALTPAQMQADRVAEKVARRAKGYAKPDRPDGYHQLFAELRTPIGEELPEAPVNYRFEAVDALEAAPRVETPRTLGKSGAPVGFTEVGPGNVSGRTRAFVIDRNDADGETWFAGGVGGGIWKTTDAGASWTHLTPALPALAITALVQSPSNPQVFYAGTGEGFGNTGAIRGDGLFKSFDGGDTWTQLVSTTGAEFDFVNRLVIDPASENVVVAVTDAGIYRTVNGGATWTQTYDAPADVQHVVATPASFAVQYASVNGTAILKSTDGGITWTESFSLAGMRRAELAVAPSNSDVVYASVEDGADSRLYVTRDAGASWAEVADANPVASERNKWLKGQGWYDNVVAVHPTIDTVLYLGGVDAFRADVSAQDAGLQTTVTHNATTLAPEGQIAPVNFGAGGINGTTLASNFFANGLSEADYKDLEIRMGGANTQKAHRFLFGAGWQYVYQDYVDVPFEVWDVENDVQLAVSFRDHDDDGAFNLGPVASTNPGGREYLFVHDVPYAQTADASVAQTGGNTHRALTFGWYIMPEGATWDASAPPQVTIGVDVTVATLSLVDGVVERMTNWYPGLTNPVRGGKYPYIHADQHSFTLVPRAESAAGMRWIATNDGGVFYSDDGGLAWTDANGGYRTTQFYDADKGRGTDVFIGGLQDNGTWASPTNPTATSAWTEQFGGDGFGSVIHGDDSNKRMGSLYYNRIRVTSNGGATWAEVPASALPVANNTSESGFVTMIGQSDADPDVVFATSKSGIYRSDDFGQSWRLADFADADTWYAAAGGRSPIDVSDADPQNVWAVTAYTTFGDRVQRSTDGGLSFAPTGELPGQGSLFASGISAHTTDPDGAFVTFSSFGSPKIYGTTDGGATWTNLTGTFTAGQPLSSNGFPDVATYDVLTMPDDPDEIWAATEIGLVVSNDGGATWGLSDYDFPRASIWQMRLVDDEVVLATHGLGVWTATLGTAYAPPAATRSPRLAQAAQAPSGRLVLSVDRRAAYDSLVVLRDGARAGRFGANAAPVEGDEVSFPVMVSGPETTELQVVAYRDGRAYKSAPRTAALSPMKDPVVSYETDADAAESMDDFSADGFSQATPAGFTTGAFHTDHPYADATEPTLTLDQPIVVALTGTALTYRDVAIVEPGTDGTAFGDAQFWDYVVVEGTKDGATWQPLAPGYDARADADWLAAYTNGAAGSDALMREQSIDLLDTFATGDTVFVRFRLVADANTNGWGWAVDDISVQKGGILPVELVAFDGVASDTGVELTWATASETNNEGFTVERQTDLDAAWTAVGRRAGAGTTLEVQRYRFTDADVPFEAQTVRYRLLQRDLDGAFEYSGIVEVDLGTPQRFAVRPLFPNPVRGAATLRYELPRQADVQVAVYDVSGRMVLRPIVATEEAGRRETRLDVGTLASGTYFVRVTAGPNVDTQTITIVR